MSGLTLTTTYLKITGRTGNPEAVVELKWP